MPKFSNLNYNDMKPMNHNGVGHRNGENITVHVLNMLDGTNHYEHKNGKLHIKSLHFRGGKIVRGEHITIEEHNNRYMPRIKNPLV